MPVHTTPKRQPASMRLAFSFLFCTTTVPARAEEQPQPEQRPQAEPYGGPTIVVVAPRGSLRGAGVDRTVGADIIPAYGVSTIDELVNELADETGEDEPVVIVNGERIDDYGDVSDLPIEAVERVDILPRGSGAQVGASPRGRVFNIVLRREVKTLVASASYRVATDGESTGRSADLTATRIQGPNRLNVAFRVRDEDRLLESDRSIIQPEQRFPFTVGGTVIPDPRTTLLEVDPALSALAGRPVLRTAIPSVVGRPPLSAFVPTANLDDELDLGQFRTLRPANRTYDLTASIVQRLMPWLTASLNARLSASDSKSLTGRATGLFVLPQTNALSPFSRDVGIAAARAQALQSSFNSLNTSISGTLNANFGDWQVSLFGSYAHSDRRFLNDRQDFTQLASPIVLADPTSNPLGGALGDILIVGTDRSLSMTDTNNVRLTGSGSPLRLPAGPLRMTLSAGLIETELTSSNRSFGTVTDRQFSRSEREASTILAVPIASRRAGVLPWLGELNANFEYGIVDTGQVGTLARYTAGLDWAPQDWIRFAPSIQEARTPPAVELLADPIVVTPSVRFFDFLSGNTVDVTQIYGGNPLLLPQTTSTRRLNVNIAPWRKINLQLNAEYQSTETSDFISGLPPASVAVLLAFPDRFRRDASGVLTTVDTRPVNFERQSLEQLRYGFSFMVPIGPAPQRAQLRPGGDGAVIETGEAGEMPMLPAGPRPRLQVVANHTWLLNNKIMIRPGLPAIDLLDRGAIGIGGGRQRHQIDFSLAASARGIGARLSGLWRSESRLELRQGPSVGLLRFAPLFTTNFTVFVEGVRLFPGDDLFKGSRFTFSVVNIANDRQRVRDTFGNTPLNYQPGYRDAIGRTVEIGLRKVF